MVRCPPKSLLGRGLGSCHDAQVVLALAPIVAARLALVEPEGTASEPTAIDPGPVAVADALVLEPGATCLEHDRLTEQVVTWLERDALDPRLTVVVEGDPLETRSLRFTLQDRGQPIAERRFAPGPSSCDDLHSVVALAIALAVDATVLESMGIGPTPTPTPPPTPPPTPEPALPDRTAIEPSPRLDLEPRRRPADDWAVRAELRGLLTVGIPPTLGGGGQLGVEAGWRDLVDVRLGALGTSSGSRPAGEGTLTITLAAARADLCVGPRLRRVRPRACTGVLAGGALAQGRGFLRDYRTRLPWVAMAVGGDVRVGLGPRTALSFGLDGIVSLVRPVFDLAEDFEVRELRDLPRFGAALGVGVVVSLR